MANGIMSTAAEKQSKTAKSPAKSRDMKGWVEAYAPEIKKALPSAITTERFTRLVLSSLSATPKLQECNVKSFLGAMMQAAQLGLEVNSVLGQAYLIPRKNGKTGETDVVFELGYKGLLDLAYRGGVVEVSAETVYEHDEFEYELGLERALVHKPALKDRGDPICFYATYRTKDGGRGFAVMSVEDVRKHAAKYSDSYKRGINSPWVTSFEAMALKTTLKQALKFAPLTAEAQKQITADQTVKTELSEDMFSLPDASVVETEFADTETVDPVTGEINTQAPAGGL